jgi:spore coat polysaccharide biosynthesis predicted glycosyltransferase SpsG
MVNKHGYELHSAVDHGEEEEFDYREWINRIVNDAKPKAIVLDVRDDLPVQVLREWRDKRILIVTIDDPSDRRLLADLAFYPPVPQVKKMDWTGFKGELYTGWDWVILRPEFQVYRNVERCTRNGARPNILVTMGGSDPAGLTLRVMEAIGSMKEDFVPIVLLGPGFSHQETLANIQAISPRSFEVLRNQGDIAGLMAGVDMAIAAAGVTAYELAAMGVPSIYLCLTEDHSASAAVFHEQGMGINLGLHSSVSSAQIARAISDLLDQPERRDAMAREGRALLDGNGSKRIAGLVVHHFRTR